MSTPDDLSTLAANIRERLMPLSRVLRRGDGTMTPTQLSVIGAIHRHGPISMGDLATREHLSRPMISRVVSSLEGSGLIDRGQDHSDRRICLLSLSEVGQEWVRAGRDFRNASLAERLARLEPADLVALSAALPAFDRLLDADD